MSRTRRLATAVLALTLAGGLGGCVTDAHNPPPSPAAAITAGPGAAGPPGSTGPTPAADAGLSHPVADPLYPGFGHPDLDVLSYRLDLAWAPTTRVLTGTATLAIRATVAVSQLALDFDNSYTVDGAMVDQRAEPATRAGHDLVVPIDHPVPADGRVTLVVRYHGVPHQIPFPSDRSDAIEGLGLRSTSAGEAWTMQEPYGASTWYPVNDHPSDEATYDISVTVPVGWSAVANGTPGPVSASAAGVTYHYVSTDPVASYVTTLAIGHYTKISDSGPGGLPLTYWVRTGRDEAFEPALRRMPQLLAWLSDHFGPYPFPTAGAVLVDSDSAMETQQMITFGARVNDGPPDIPDTDETLLHELSHQWFGDSVTPTNWLGLWLNEGWATYAEWRWTVDQGMQSDAGWIAFARDRDALSRASAGPAGHPKVGHFAENNVYLGPALMLHAIRQAVGDQAFFAMARDWAQTHRNMSVDRAEFVAFVNRHTGRDFTDLINTWLDSPTEPPA